MTAWGPGCRRPACVESALRVEADKSRWKADIPGVVSAEFQTETLPIYSIQGLVPSFHDYAGITGRGDAGATVGRLVLINTRSASARSIDQGTRRGQGSARKGSAWLVLIEIAKTRHRPWINR